MPNPNHEPAGSSKGGEFAKSSDTNQKMNDAIRKEVGIYSGRPATTIHGKPMSWTKKSQLELITSTDDSKRMDVFDELKMGKDEEPKNAGMQEIHSAVGDVTNNLYIKRDSQGHIIAAASYSIDGGYNMNGHDVSMVHINHIGSIQAGEGMSLVKTLEDYGKKQGAKGMVLESRYEARDYWVKTGFSLMGNSANRFMKKI